MTFYADLHVHSKYSRATSRNCDLEHLALWARKKGIAIVGTGDFTHPAWRAEITEKLVPAEPGLFRLRPDLERAVGERLPAACRSERTTTRFMLSVEISTIYKKLDKTRKIHHLIYTPDFEAMERVTASLARIGNVNSDGRPILGLDSRHLLEITLESDPGSYLVPAHIWTPWFAALGSKSGFDAIDECYGDLAGHIFAVETGLSSDPPMNWRVSSLDRFRLVSNSDAHSPEKLGREVCVFDTDLDYFALRRALETGEGYGGTLEFFPEEGKYHLDGHRSCEVRLSPNETRRHGGRCPVCGKPLTVGVMHRVEDLADRPEEVAPPATAGTMQSLVPLPEILSEILEVGPKSRRVARHYESLLGRLGPELPLLNTLPLEDIRPASSSLVAEAVARLRRKEVVREAGYDGVYGTIRLFENAELHGLTRGHPSSVRSGPRRARRRTLPLRGARTPRQGTKARLHGRIRPDSLRPFRRPRGRTPSFRRTPVRMGARVALPMPAASCPGSMRTSAARRRSPQGPLLIVAGPGSGKTRTLTHRIAHLVANQGVLPTSASRSRSPGGRPARCAIACKPCCRARGRTVPVHTFHSFGLSILREHWNAAGLQRGFRVASDDERVRLLRDTLDLSSGRPAGTSRPSRARGAPPHRRREAEPARPRRRTGGRWSSGTGSTSTTSSSGPRTCWNPIRPSGPRTGGGTPSSRSTSTRTSTRSRSGSSGSSRLRTGTCARSATPTRRSTASGARTFASSPSSGSTSRGRGSSASPATTARTGTSSPSPRRSSLRPAPARAPSRCWRRRRTSSPSTRRPPRRRRRSSSSSPSSRRSGGTASSPSTAGARRRAKGATSRSPTSPCSTAPRRKPLPSWEALAARGCRSSSARTAASSTIRQWPRWSMPSGKRRARARCGNGSKRLGRSAGTGTLRRRAPPESC